MASENRLRLIRFCLQSDLADDLIVPAVFLHKRDASECRCSQCYVPCDKSN